MGEYRCPNCGKRWSGSSNIPGTTFYDIPTKKNWHYVEDDGSEEKTCPKCARLGGIKKESWNNKSNFPIQNLDDIKNGGKYRDILKMKTKNTLPHTKKITYLINECDENNANRTNISFR